MGRDARIGRLQLGLVVGLGLGAGESRRGLGGRGVGIHSNHYNSTQLIQLYNLFQ